jgi:hypothetical protein
MEGSVIELMNLRAKKMLRNLSGFAKKNKEKIVASFGGRMRTFASVLIILGRDLKHLEPLN